MIKSIAYLAAVAVVGVGLAACDNRSATNPGTGSGTGTSGSGTSGTGSGTSGTSTSPSTTPSTPSNTGGTTK